MFPHQVACSLLIAVFALSSTGCGFSFWPWGKRGDSIAAEPRRETKPEKCARLVRAACDAAVAVRRADMLELEGAAIVGAQSGGADQSARVARRASSAGRSAADAYLFALLKLSKLPDQMVDDQIARFAYQDSKWQALLATLKPVMRRHLHETRLGLKLTQEACAQDLQSVRYSP